MATTTTRAVPQPDAATTERDRLRVALLGALIVLVPVAKMWSLWNAAGGAGDVNRSVVVAPFDLALVGLLALFVADRGKMRTLGVGRRPRDAVTLLAFALGALALVSSAAHPSPRALDLALRIAGAAAVVHAWGRVYARSRHRLQALLLGVAAAQSVLAMVQSARGRALGVEWLDYRGALYAFGDSHGGRGGLTHPYHLVVFLLVAIAAGVLGVRGATRRAPWFAGLALCGAGVAVTYSRTALLALVPAALLVAFAAPAAARRTLRLAVVCTAVGFAFGALSFGDGWYARYEQSTGGTGVDSGRTVLWRDAGDAVADAPLLGVGPGRYTIDLAERPHDGQLLPPHDVVVHAAAELGIPGAALAVALGAALLARARGRAALAWVPLVVVAPYYLLDAYPYVFPTGIALSGLAVALLLAEPMPERNLR